MADIIATVYCESVSIVWRYGRDVFEDNMVEAKAKATKFCPRGVLEVEASPRGPPSMGFFLPRELRRERLCQVVCLSITLKFNALLPPLVRLCIVFMVLSPLLTILKNSTSYGQTSKPKSRPRIVEAKAKAKARALRGQGQGQGHKILSSSCPRGRGQSSRTPSLWWWWWWWRWW